MSFGRKSGSRLQRRSISGAIVLASLAVSLIIYQFSWASEAIDTSLIIFHFHGPDTTSSVGTYISSLGDINNDAFDDIAVYCNFPSGTYMFYGGNPVDNTPDKFYDLCFDIQTIEDITGDDIRDGMARKFDGLNHSSDRLYFFQGYEDSLASMPFDSLLPETTVTYFGIQSDSNIFRNSESVWLY
jgi:hypothetical protein